MIVDALRVLIILELLRLSVQAVWPYALKGGRPLAAINGTQIASYSRTRLLPTW